MAEDHTGQRLDLYIRHRGALRFGETAHLILGKADIVQLARAQFADQRLDLIRAQPEAWRRIAVEFLRKFAHGRVAARADIGQRFFDDGAGLGVILGPFGFGFGGFQVFNRHVSLSQPADRAHGV